jgi:uncharacterized OB-fold protein
MEYRFTKPGAHGEIALIGSRCLDCRGVFFPTRANCSRCFGHRLEDVELSRLGELRGFTIVRQAPSGYFGPVPYVIGNVTLNDGVFVVCPMAGKAVEEWRTGDAVAAFVLRLPASRSGETTVDCFSFQPRRPGDA